MRSTSGPGVGPSGVKGHVGQDLRHLVFGHAVFPSGEQMVLEGAVHQPLAHQHGGGGLFAYDEAIMGWLFGAHPGGAGPVRNTHESE